MTRVIVFASLLALSACATPSEQVDREVAEAEPVDAVLSQYGFEGEVAFSRDADTISRRQDGGADRIWPWTSVTKQVVATMIMQNVAGGAIALDAPVSDYIVWTDETAPTIRQLLRHQSGLTDFDRHPDFSNPADRQACTTSIGAPGGEFADNNCDFYVLGRVLEEVEGKPFGALLRDKIVVPADLKATGLATASTPIAGEGTPASTLAGYGAAGAMVGTTLDLIAFDRGLLSGHLLDEEAREAMWRGDPALGQWSFAASLKGCDGPVRIVERRGAIGNYQSRNYILPDRDFAMVAFTDQGDIDFGEIGTGEGLSYDMLSAAAC